MTPTSQERARGQEENWGRPLGGTDFLLDPNKRTRMAGVKHGRKGKSNDAVEKVHRIERAALGYAATDEKIYL